MFGAMGMAIGAMAGYKPAQYRPSEYNMSSEQVKIDDRSVILNYFSVTHKQFMDIELPTDCYNFLQTHLPERKYDIVLEVEKKSVVDDITGQKHIDQVENSTQRLVVSQLSTNDFEEAVKKLKILKDNDIITQEEFVIEKKKLLNLI